MKTPNSSQISNNNNNAFMSFSKFLWYANIMLSIFYVTFITGSIITFHFTNEKKKKKGLEKLRDSS